MEALLKLIVGVDGVTAVMLTQIAYLYVAGKAITSIALAGTFLGVTAIITKTVRWNIDRLHTLAMAKVNRDR